MAKYKCISKIIDGPSKGVSFEGEERDTCNEALESIMDVYASFVSVYHPGFDAEQAGDEQRALENMGWWEDVVYKDGVILDPRALDWLV